MGGGEGKGPEQGRGGSGLSRSGGGGKGPEQPWGGGAES